MAFTKLTSFSKKPSDLPDVPSPSMTPDDIRSMWETPLDELLSNTQDTVDKLNATTSGSSGADNIGATGWTGAANTIQALLNWLKANKTDLTGDHKGTWQGFKPTQTDPGIQGQVDSNTAQLADIAIIVKASGGDDTQAIQNAINSLPNGGTILLPDPLYLISGSSYVLTAKSNIQFKGRKGLTTIKLNSATGTTYMIGSSSHVENIRIRGITFDGNYPTLTNNTYAYYFPDVKNFSSGFNTYKNFGGQGVNYGDVTLAQDILHSNDYFDTILGTGILTHNNKKIRVVDCHFNNVKDSNINVTAETVEDVETFVLISGNVAICPSDFVSGHSVFSLMGDNTQAVNNKIQGGSVQMVVHTGPFGKNLRNYLIDGNILENGGNGLMVYTDVNAKVIVKNNFVKDSLGSPITVSGWDGSSANDGQCIISDNIIDGGATQSFTQYQVPMSIKISGLYNGIIKGNIIKKPNYAGIGFVGNNQNVLVYGNTIDGHIGTTPTDATTHYGAPIYIDKLNTTTVQKNIVVEANIITNFMTGVPSPLVGGVYGAGIVVVGSSSNVALIKQIAIKNNHIDTGSGNGISVAYTTDSKVVNNSVWGSGQATFNNVTNTNPYVTNAVI